MSPDDTQPCDAPVVELDSEELVADLPTTGSYLVTAEDYAAAGRVRPLPPRTDAKFTPGIA